MIKKATGFLLGLLTAIFFYANVSAVSQQFEAEGVFIMGDNDNRTQAKDFALQDAKRLALEQAGTYLSSVTQVVNGQVKKDEIISIASGVIKLERILTEETKTDGALLKVVVKARFIIDSDDLQKKMNNLYQSEKRQEEIQQLTDLRYRYEKLLAENNRLKSQIPYTDNQNTKEQLLNRAKNISKQLLATKRFNEGVEYSRNNKEVSACIAYTDAINYDPLYVEAYYMRGLEYHKRTRLLVSSIDIDYAIQDFDIAIGLGLNTAQVYTARGYAYYLGRGYDRAIADYSEAIALDSNFVDAYNGRGICYARKGLHDKAIADYERAIVIDRQNLTAYLNKGFSYAQKGIYDRAIADYDRCIAINQYYADAYYFKALSYEKIKDFHNAAEAYYSFIQYHSVFEEKAGDDKRLAYARERLLAIKTGKIEVKK